MLLMVDYPSMLFLPVLIVCDTGPDAIIEDDGDENYTDEGLEEEEQMEGYDLAEDLEDLAEEAALHNTVHFDVRPAQEESSGAVF
jgi:hypothetical protein